MGFQDFMKNLSGNRFSGLKGGQQDIAFLRSLQRDLKQKDTTHIPLKDLQVVVFDLETTGFHPDKGDHILSIGAVKVTGSQQENEFYSLVQYQNSIPEEVKQLTGLTEQDVQKAPPAADALHAFFQFTNAAPLVAHHANHEKAFMSHASRKYLRTPFSHRLIDTSFLLKIAEEGQAPIRLEDCCESNGISVIDRHHALGDARLTAKLWSLYIEKLEDQGVGTLSQLYEKLAVLR